MCQKLAMNLQFNPAYQIVPPLGPEEYDRLRESIEQNGVLMPIVVDEHGFILDGHNRVEIARDLGLLDSQIPSLVKDGLNEEQKLLFVTDLNLRRRQMTTRQKVQTVMRIEPIISAQRVNHMLHRDGLDDYFAGVFASESPKTDIVPEAGLARKVRAMASLPGDTRDLMGQLAGVSGKTYQRVSRDIARAEQGIYDEPTTTGVSFRLPIAESELWAEKQREFGMSKTQLAIKAVRCYQGPTSHAMEH
jgi:hypothetical protein